MNLYRLGASVVQSLKAGSLCSLPLQELYLADCKITDSHLAGLAGLTKLTKLDLRYNSELTGMRSSMKQFTLYMTMF